MSTGPERLRAEIERLEQLEVERLKARVAELEAKLRCADRDIKRLGERLRKFDDCIPTNSANTTLRLRDAHHATQLAEAVEAERKSCTSLADWAITEAVAKEREAIAKLVFELLENGQTSLDDVLAAIRARGAR